MTALELKQLVLKPEWVNKFEVIVSLDDLVSASYRCKDEEELPERSKVSLRAIIKLPEDESK